jgi:segregation and condensation protein A
MGRILMGTPVDETDRFEEDSRDPAPGETFVVDLDGYEGPIDVLLALARNQKVDLARISILQLAEQYLAFITEARGLRIEIAAEYLVMAAWLAYLKSRLLLPEPEPDDDGPTGSELAEALTFQLRRLESMQQAGARLMSRPRLGRDVFARGAPEGVEVVKTSVLEVSLFDILKAYGDSRRRVEASSLRIEPSSLFNIADAIQRLSGLLGDMTDWRTLMSYLPPELLGNGLVYRSAVAATFAASLELARTGKIELRQSSSFGPIHVRRGRAQG